MKKGDRAKGDRRGISPGFKKSSAVEVGRVRNYGFPRSELWEDFYDVLVAHTRQDEEEVLGGVKTRHSGRSKGQMKGMLSGLRSRRLRNRSISISSYPLGRRSPEFRPPSARSGNVEGGR
ncbi:hypothetical protein AP9108_32815 [Arthrospira sp. PCC 9108]|nr:hypothetical protein AP9108_32815 [Arthrospira sp. PCC 9108]